MVQREILIRINFSGAHLIKCPVAINIERDRFEIQKYRSSLLKNSFAEKFPHIAAEWHPVKNENLMPDMFKAGSNHKVWWKCPNCGNEYQSSIGHRTSGTGCPKCAINRVTQAKQKAVNMINPETNEIIKTFDSISEASMVTDINISNISMVCKGWRSLAGGYRWKYKDED